MPRAGDPPPGAWPSGAGAAFSWSTRPRVARGASSAIPSFCRKW